MNQRISQFGIPLFLGIIIGIVFITVLSIFKKDVFISPLSSSPEILAAKIPSKKPIIGFLPYWNVNTAEIPYHLLDYIAYFGIGLNADGTIKKYEDQNMDIGFLKLQSDEVDDIFNLAKKQDVGIMLVFTAFNNEVIDAIVGNPDYSKQAIKSIISMTKEYEAEAVNIDFEYNQSYSISQKPEAYIQFISDLKSAFVKEQMNTLVSLDLYANAFIQTGSYNSAELAKVADWLVLMGYDFYQSSSPKAGPIAPIKSETGKSITMALDSALKNNISSNKIILAMPFYGYEWQTTTEDYNAPTYPGSGAMASYRRITKLIADKNIKPLWDNQAMSPWFAYEENGITQQVYYENDQSIGLKLQLINQANLQGAAIWALGYEGSDASVWKVIEQWRKNQN